MQDPDSWPLIQLFVSLFVTAFCVMYIGATAEQSSPKDNSESGIGMSFKTIASVLLALPFAVWAVVTASSITGALGRLVFHDAGPSLMTVAFYLFVAVGEAVFIATFFVVLPFSWGRARSDRAIKRMRVLRPFCALFMPLAKFISFPARRLLRARGVDSEIGAVTEEDVLELVDSATENEFIDESQKEMIGNIFELDDVTAADIMTHRTEIEAVPITSTVDDIVAVAVKFGYSRIPVYDGTLDNITGIAYVKDFLPYVGKGTKGVDLTKLYRPTLFVPESCRARELLFEFKQNKIQLAVVVDEYGGTAGIVTMEDILESIVGDIEDEYDEEESYIVHNPDGTLTCDGFADIEDVFELLGFDEVPEDVESETVGGLVTDLLARIPKKGEQPAVTYKDFELTALAADERRITSVLVKAKNKEQ